MFRFLQASKHTLKSVQHTRGSFQVTIHYTFLKEKRKKAYLNLAPVPLKWFEHTIHNSELRTQNSELNVPLKPEEGRKLSHGSLLALRTLNMGQLLIVCTAGRLVGGKTNFLHNR